MAAAILSYFLHDNTDAAIIIAIVLISGLLGLWQEKGAANLVSKLLSIVQTKATVVRDGTDKEIAVAGMCVPGDIVVLSAGSIVPGDCLLLELKDLFVDEAALTGESYPVDKVVGPVPVDAPLAKRVNTLFMGTHVISGSGRAVVVNTGRQTEFGRISEQLRLRPPETDFERGIRRFRLSADGSNPVARDYHLRVKCLLPPSDSGLLHVRYGVGRRSDAAIAAGDHHDQSRARLQETRRQEGDCQTIGLI